MNKLKLRRFTVEDKEQYYKISSSESVKRYFPYYSNSLEEAEEIIDIFLRSDFYKNYYIAIESEDDKLLVGAIIVERINNDVCNIGYFIGEEYQGMGYCTVALTKVLSYLKEQGFVTASFSIETANAGSIKVANKIGALQVAANGIFTSWKANL